jgi:hypothetical protein
MVYTESFVHTGFKRKFDRRRTQHGRGPQAGGLRAGTLLEEPEEDHYSFVFGHYRLPGHAAVPMSRCRSGQARAAGLLAARADSDRARRSGQVSLRRGGEDATGPGPPAPCCI